MRTIFTILTWLAISLPSLAQSTVDLRLPVLRIAADGTPTLYEVERIPSRLSVEILSGKRIRVKRPDLPMLKQGERQFKLGCLPPRPEAMSRLKAKFSRLQSLPRSEWVECDWRWAIVNVDDQDGLGSCASNASTGGLETVRAMHGLDPVTLSFGQLYGQITTSDVGSSLSDNLAHLQMSSKGVCPTELVPPLNWRRSSWPAGWEATAKRYRAIEYTWTGGEFDEIATAVQSGWPGVYALYVGNNFRPGSDGWLPDYRSGTGGHAMLCVGLVKKNGKWGLLTLNSWGADWGVNGCCVVPESYLRSDPFDDSWSLRLIVDPTGDGDLVGRFVGRTRGDRDVIPTETRWGLAP